MTDLSKTIGELDTKRREFGADSPEGWILSNAIEQLKNLEKAETPEQKAALMAFIADTKLRLAQLLEHRNRQAGEG